MLTRGPAGRLRAERRGDRALAPARHPQLAGALQPGPGGSGDLAWRLGGVGSAPAEAAEAAEAIGSSNLVNFGENEAILLAMRGDTTKRSPCSSGSSRVGHRWTIRVSRSGNVRQSRSSPPSADASTRRTRRAWREPGQTSTGRSGPPTGRLARGHLAARQRPCPGRDRTPRRALRAGSHGHDRPTLAERERQGPRRRHRNRSRRVRRGHARVPGDGYADPSRDEPHRPRDAASEGAPEASRQRPRRAPSSAASAPSASSSDSMPPWSSGRAPSAATSTTVRAPVS